MSGPCHDEHGGHDHDHSEHDHSNDITPALQSHLYQQIDFDRVTTLNEAVPDSGAMVLKKEWSQRLDAKPDLHSDVDEQLLMHIPFIAQIKLHALLIRTSDSPNAPRKLKLFRNRENIDFSTAAELSPTQSLVIPRNSEVTELPLNRAHWNGTTSITLFFEDNHSDGVEDVTILSYLGFKGEFLALNREPVSVLYEAAANPSDHVAIQGLTRMGSKTMPGQ